MNLIPTAEEIERAYNEITARGPGAKETMQLTILCLRNPLLKAIVGNHVKNLEALFKEVNPDLLMAAVIAVFVAGLNMGLTAKHMEKPS